MDRGCAERAILSNITNSWNRAIWVPLVLYVRESIVALFEKGYPVNVQRLLMVIQLIQGVGKLEHDLMAGEVQRQAVIS